MSSGQGAFLWRPLYRCAADQSSLPVGLERRSQSNEDLWLWNNLFSKLPPEERYGGTFIELGAVDGGTYSNTWMYEKNFDWRGVLIEGHPDNSRKLRSNAKSRANSAIFTNSICQAAAGGTELGQLHFTAKGGAIGAAVELADPKFMAGWHKDSNTTAGGAGQVTVDCVPLQELLEATGVLDVDFFSLDVEGAEMVVLQTLDWSRVNVRVLLVELDGHSPKKDDAVRELLRGLGFVAPDFGVPRDACSPGADCTSNDAFINPNYAAVKRARGGRVQHRYHYGTGQRCAPAA